jgi:phospholipid/cholesterol/gamma-HCH transport system substrate-binding protein
MRAFHTVGTRAFLIGGLILFSAGLFFISNRQKLFHHNFEVYTEFVRLNGLQNGAQVRVSGMAAGELVATQVPNRPDGRFRLKLRIQENLHVLVRLDSVATIKTMGLAGSSFIDIQKGSQRAPESPSGGTIPSQEPFDIADLIQQGTDLLKTTQTSIDTLRPELQAVMVGARQTAQDVREIVTHVKQGQGTIGKLVADRKLADSIDQIVADARQSVLELKSISARMNDTIADFQRRDLLGRSQALLENARQVTEQLKQVAAALASSPSVEDGSAGNLRDTLASARTTMANLVADSEALKRNFFLRGFFKRQGYYTLDQMTPAEYRSSKFLQGNSSERIWLSNDELFSSGSGETEELTQEGQRQIDDAMGALVPYLPNSPMVVEGYAAQGSPSERFIRAQERATVVKTYIVKRFGLHPHMVGMMPMSDPAPRSVGKSAWDGVSLVLIR